MTTEEITRANRRRNGSREDPQAAFGDEVINVESEDGQQVLEWYLIREANREAKAAFAKADSDITEWLKSNGYYDGNPHNIRVGEFITSLAQAEGEAKEISFTRHPTIRKTIRKLD